ncbi:hypothetical protein [Paraconexibacter algicola]|uniref:Protein SirB1 N-terminal domain-containing protein n=1 Tax=Paraconexibacter algicola TaxID=2133960 RepID=A0A2T4UIP8_9ACTN|nr:hypothetical protein [Paraconexibacter algicola]PTL59099.1 hypothetical protein C7Y72_05280 [Paraconexibacter algicola]
MTCTTDRCATAADCTRHVALLLAGDRGTAAARSAAAADAALDDLAAALRACRSGSAARELRACAAVLAERFTVDLGGTPATLAPDRVLARGAGAPLVLGAIAVTAARRGGVALGLLAGPHGRYAVAHATYPKPLVLDLQEGFALQDVGGRESLHRWLCAHETAQRVAELRRSGRRKDARTVAPAAAPALSS